MRQVILCAFLLLVLTGCPKKKDQAQKPGQQAPSPGSTSLVSPGTGGAVQNTRQAVARTVNRNDMQQICIFINNASIETMPTAQQIAAALQQGAPQIYQHVQQGLIVLTGTRSRENIWAYTAQAQNVGGDHLVCTSNGVEQMNSTTLQQRLNQQKGQ